MYSPGLRDIVVFFEFATDCIFRFLQLHKTKNLKRTNSNFFDFNNVCFYEH